MFNTWPVQLALFFGTLVLVIVQGAPEPKPKYEFPAPPTEVLERATVVGCQIQTVKHTTSIYNAKTKAVEQITTSVEYELTILLRDADDKKIWQHGVTMVFGSSDEADAACKAWRDTALKQLQEVRRKK